MKSERWLSIGLSALLLACGVLAWSFQLRPPLAVDTSALSRLPLQVGRWQGADQPMLEDVAAMLAADFNVQRRYVHPLGGVVWLYVGYYGTNRGGRPEHTPWACYPSNGWEIVRREVVNLGGGQGRRANELVVEKDGERLLVHFWYQSYRRVGMLGGLDQAFDHLLNRILDGRADGSLVRLSTQIGRRASEAGARAYLMSFSREIVPLLRDHWPGERDDSAL